MYLDSAPAGQPDRMTRLCFHFGDARMKVAGAGAARSLYEHDTARGGARENVSEIERIALHETVWDGLLHDAARPAFRLQIFYAGVIGRKSFSAFGFHSGAMLIRLLK